MFDQHLPPQYKSKAPRVVRKKDGSDVWVFQGEQIPNIGLNAVVGRPPEEYGMEPTSYEQLRPGTYDIHERIRDMNVNGVLASMCFPSFPSLCGEMFFRQPDKELARVVLQAYNDWHIDEWCGAYPGRFIPLALLPLWDPQLMARGGAPRRQEGLPRRQLHAEPRCSSACRACTTSTGIRSGRRAATRARSCASTSAPAPGCSSPRWMRRST